jgi:FkbM family methyltransferase
VDAGLFGLKVRFHPHDNASDGKAAVFGRSFNAQELKWLDRALPQGGTFVDIGANMGFFSLFAATKGATIVAVEPHPRLFARLSNNMALNGAAARLFNCAVGGEAGMARLLVSPDLGVGRIGEGGEGFEVPVRTLADILGEAGVTRVDALKIDIEGYEDRALVPFFETADRALWPRSLVIELSAAKDWRADLQALLRACGYRTRARSRGNAWLERTP